MLFRSGERGDVGELHYVLGTDADGGDDDAGQHERDDAQIFFHVKRVLMMGQRWGVRGRGERTRGVAYTAPPRPSPVGRENAPPLAYLLEMPGAMDTPPFGGGAGGGVVLSVAHPPHPRTNSDQQHGLGAAVVVRVEVGQYGPGEIPYRLRNSISHI